jgi:hypothetical protein
MAAVRKALDSTYVRMTVCFVQQELRARLVTEPAQDEQIEALLSGMQDLLSKAR